MELNPVALYVQPVEPERRSQQGSLAAAGRTVRSELGGDEPGDGREFGCGVAAAPGAVDVGWFGPWHLSVELGFGFKEQPAGPWCNPGTRGR